MFANVIIKLLASVKGNTGTSRWAGNTAKRAGMNFVMKGDTLGMFNKHCHGLS